jgi:choline dehydrogenase
MNHVVIVGGGTAGSVLAARLSEDPHRQVTLVEAGASGDTPAELLDGGSIPAVVAGHPANWGYRGWLQPDASHVVPRGRVLGGSSAINGGYFIRARPQDFDRWAEVSGPQWSYESALPFLKKLENDLDFGDDPGHGTAGPLRVRRPAQSGQLASLFARAAQELGFAVEGDKNAGSGPIGVGPVPSNIIDGTRVNAAMAYLSDARERPNLVVVGDTRVLRIRIEGGKAVGVETEREFIEADEVIVAAGSVATPHLLMLSGIGPAAELEALGIASMADLPVGQGFSDHANVAVGWHSSADLDDRDERVAFPTALNFDSSGRDGAAVDGDLEILLVSKPTSVLFGASAAAVAGGGSGPASDVSEDEYQLLVALQQPVARGHMTLESSDPLVQPRIDYNYLHDERDRARLRVGVRTAATLLHSPSFAGTFAGFSSLSDDILTDDALLDAWIASHLSTAIHLSGSAAIGPVVDWQGRVHGVDALRVADTSILPTVPSRGTFNTAVFIGEFVAHHMMQVGDE